MAYVHFIFTLLIAIISSVAPLQAKDIIVGDGHGWTLNFDYQSWALGNQFHVGDNLIFIYKQGVHNVYKVNGTGFNECSSSSSLSAAFTSGFDVITLATPGRKWYICGVGSHCANGKMKLFINVLPPVVSWSPAPAPAPVPSPKSMANEFIVGDEYGWTLNYDYQSWAMGKIFHVGDKLIFNYKQGSHNVYKVDGTGFKQCSAAASLGQALTSGNDEITLVTPGRKWYICGVGTHCAYGKMKLFINVLPPVASWSPPVPPPTPYYPW